MVAKGIRVRGGASSRWKKELKKNLRRNGWMRSRIKRIRMKGSACHQTDRNMEKQSEHVCVLEGKVVYETEVRRWKKSC